VLLVLFIILLALSIWAWNPPSSKEMTFSALQDEVLDLQSPGVYPVETLPTPDYPAPSGRTIPHVVSYVVFDGNKYPKNENLTHLQTWEHKTYTIAQQDEFMATTFGSTWPDIVHAYNLCHLTEMRLCLFKYSVVYYCGGLYVDRNAVSLKPFDDLVSSDKALVAPCATPSKVGLFGDMTHGQGEYETWWVMAPPKSEFLWQVVWQLVRNIFLLHAQGKQQCKFVPLSADITESVADSICYTYVACKFKYLTKICTNNFLSLRHNSTTHMKPRFVDLLNPHLVDIPMQLVYIQNRKPATSISTKHQIPVIIHQTHETRWLTPVMARAIRCLQDHAPYCEYRFYDDGERRRFIEQNYPSALDAYNVLVPGSYRADLFRAIVVYTLGGVYFDLGFSPSQGTDLFGNVIAENDEIVFSIDEWVHGILTGFFAATKRHPYLQTIIEHIIDNVDKRKTFAYQTDGVYRITGPKAYADALHNVLPHPLKEGVHHLNLRLLFFPFGTSVYKNGKEIYKTQYTGYHEEQKMMNRGTPHYKELWSKNQVYNTSVMKDLQRLRNFSTTRWPTHIPVLYINLDRATHRNECTLREIADVSDSITRISAIDGTNIHNSHVVIINDFTNLTFGEIGCTASHLKAIKCAFDMNVEKAIICEDDVCFAPMRVWTQTQIDDFCESVTNDVGLVLLCWGNRQYGAELKLDRVRTLACMFGTVAYIVTRRGMSDILAHAEVSNSSIHLRKSSSVTHGVADGYLFMLTNVATSSVPLALPNNLVNKTQIVGRQNGDPDRSHFAQMEEIVRVAMNIANTYNKQICIDPFNFMLAYDYIQSRPKRYWPRSIPVLYINLERSQDRRLSVERTLAQSGVVGERVNAFDGKFYNDVTKTIKDVSVTCDFPHLTPCELATTASHLTAIKLAYDKGFEMVLICEDDVSFTPLGLWTQSQINVLLSSIPLSTGIFLLYWIGKSYGDKLEVSQVTSVNNDLYGATSYIITRHGMQQVLSNARILGKSIHWKKTHDNQQGEADNYLFSITNVATSGVPLLFADNTTHKQTITDRPSDHPGYQHGEFRKAVQAMCKASCNNL
jgi:GR25 family glycosyltransferase involved in LPS biosynthesis/mannosyltransferase OCH1-like enzyme